MTDQTATLAWKDGVPIATRFDDPYYSLANGLAETQHVFLAGNGLPARFGGDFQIAELGFGTGLNFLVTWQAWRDAGSPGRLQFTSFEAFPMAVSDMVTALGGFSEISGLATELTTAWQPGIGPLQLADNIALHVVIGDARQTVPDWDGMADAWFLDGFSPAKNPSLWEPDLLHAVGTHTKPGGTAATYSAAGHVRQKLSDAGFDVARIKGFGRKRHMTQAVMPRAK